MSKTLIERARSIDSTTITMRQNIELCCELADEIERLQKDNQQLHEVDLGNCWSVLHKNMHKRAECYSCCPFCAEELHVDVERLCGVVEKLVNMLKFFQRTKCGMVKGTRKKIDVLLADAENILKGQQ